jgi:FixJ family two-component response regulator
MEPDKLVFVVDDDAPLRESLTDLIHSVGLRVEAFASAREFLRSKRPDVPGAASLARAVVLARNLATVCLSRFETDPIDNRATT